MNTLMRSTPSGEAQELAYYRLRAALDQFGQSPAALGAEQRAQADQRAHQEYALERQVLSAPEACDVVIADHMVTQAQETVRSRYPSEDAFNADLERNNLSQETLWLALQRELTVEAVLDKVGARAAQVNDLEVKLYYYLHLERFVQPETRTLRHVLITVNEQFPENHPAEARARIESIAARVRRKPHRFGEQAGKHSECPTGLQEGLLGRLPRGQLYPELDEVAFGMAEGEISAVVESPIGLHLLYCEQVHPAGPVSLAEARPRIHERLQARQRRLCIRNWLRNLSDGEEKP
jgi:peptidyl-prolyl cis-trans isomerase C